MSRPLMVVACLLFACACATEPADTVPELDAVQRGVLEEMMAEEDSRPAATDAAALRAGLQSDQPLLRRFAARGIGRLEDPAALPALAEALEDDNPHVRRAAATAIAQSVFNDDASAAADLLQSRLAVEPHPAARGAIAQALGRLRLDSPARGQELRDALVGQSRGAPFETLLPTLRGIEWLVRANRGDVELDDASIARLTELAHYGLPGAEGYREPDDDEDAEARRVLEVARIRRLALAALNAAGATDTATLEAAIADPDVEVRRVAVAGASALFDAPPHSLLIQTALGDGEGAVRYEALRAYDRRLRPTMGCEPVIAALDDPSPHVALLAIDLLAAGCRGREPEDEESLARVTDRLLSAAALPDADEPWHAAAHALVALAERDPLAAANLLTEHAGHATWQVRMYAARSAAALGEIETLRALAADPHPNVAEAALRGLVDELGQEAHPVALATLERDDYQLLVTAARSLQGASRDVALPALLATLERITAQRRDTSRDPRRAILERIGEVGDSGDADAVRQYLEDFDPLIAEQAAELIFAWTGATVAATPRPLAPQPVPTPAELIEIDGQRALMTMEDGGTIEIALHPYAAPTNVARFVRQAREGYFEGLTFHRVVPNFVIQGGSPGANEFVGAGPYSRDEIADRSHLRGRVGISTRGRDTGDAQIFINLVDNVRPRS